MKQRKMTTRYQIMQSYRCRRADGRAGRWSAFRRFRRRYAAVDAAAAAAAAAAHNAATHGPGAGPGLARANKN